MPINNTVKEKAPDSKITPVHTYRKAVRMILFPRFIYIMNTNRGPTMCQHFLDRMHL